jgi:hypothetical protein
MHKKKGGAFGLRFFYIHGERRAPPFGLKRRGLPVCKKQKSAVSGKK